MAKKDLNDNKKMNTEEKELSEADVLRVRVEELENNWKRALADYRNLEKRVREEKAEMAKFANSMLLSRFLGILDGMEMMQEHIKDTGLKLLVGEFKKILESENVEEINPIGKSFDPEIMDAVESVEGKENEVVFVLQKGYLFKGKVLRPARVKVGKGGK
jgi:molecular chaperone GrpE